MNKITIKQSVILLFVLVILTSMPVFASPPAPTSACSITGIIKSVEFKDAYDEPCLKEPYGCPTDMELQHPARYFLDVSINSVTHVSGDTSFNTCQNMYPVGSVQKIFINKDKVKSGDTFMANQKIDGIVRSFWGESFDSYTLLNKTPQCIVDSDCGKIQKCGMTWQCIEGACRQLSIECPLNKCVVNSDCYPEGFVPGKCGTFYTCSAGKCYEGSAACPPVVLESSKISEKLLQQNYVDNVGSVSLQSDQQTYSVHGTKKGKLFFFIPVTLDIQLEVDVTTGAVKEIKKPWWSFLVR